MKEDEIQNTARAAQEKLGQNPLPEELRQIMRWTQEMILRTDDDRSSRNALRELGDSAAEALIRQLGPKDVAARIKNLFVDPHISADDAALILQTRKGEEVPTYVYRALLKSGTKKHLVLLLVTSQWKPIPASVIAKAVKALLAHNLEPRELMVLLKVKAIRTHALQRIAKLPFNHDLYLQAVINATGEDTEKLQNDMIEKLLPHVTDPKEFEALMNASDQTTRERIALRWAEGANDPAELEKICNLTLIYSETMRPLCERTLELFPESGVLSGVAADPNKDPRKRGFAGELFRTFCVEQLHGPHRTKIMKLLRNSRPSNKEIEMMLSTATDATERETLGWEVVQNALKIPGSVPMNDRSMLFLVAEKYPDTSFGTKACLELTRTWTRLYGKDDPGKVRRLQKLYPILAKQLEKFLPTDPSKAMRKIDEDLG